MLEIRMKNFLDFIDGIIYKINGRSINDYNTQLSSLRKKTNEMISKTFTRIIDNGLDDLKLTFIRSGIEASTLSGNELSFLKTLFEDRLPEIIDQNTSLIYFLLDSVNFVKKYEKPVSGEEFRKPLFYLFSSSFLFAILAGEAGNGLHDTLRIFLITIAIITFVAAIFCVPIKIRKMKANLNSGYEELREEHKELMKVPESSN